MALVNFVDKRKTMYGAPMETVKSLRGKSDHWLLLPLLHVDDLAIVLFNIGMNILNDLCVAQLLSQTVFCIILRILHEGGWVIP